MTPTISGKTYFIIKTALIMALLVCQGAVAEDEKGQFSMRGAGLITCAMYEAEHAAKSEAYLMTAGWIDGYVTGTNQYSPETYDILSFETTELLTEILAKHCKNNPTDRVFAVVKSLFRKLQQDRLQSLSKKVEVVVGERKTSLYIEVLTRIQEKLTTEGFYKEKINGLYDKATIDAMKAFQRSAKLNATGFPDQVTLWRLLRSPSGTNDKLTSAPLQ